MLLASTAIEDGEEIPLAYAEPAAGGSNVSPALAWSEVPDGTESFAITVYDPDAPTGSGFWHWVALDIPASVTSLADGEALPDGAREWENDYGYEGYGGPCPPEGRIHRYIHTIHALPVAHLDIPEGATHAQARAAVLAHQLDSVSITGKFKRPAAS
ncbi:MAG: YbhB/YbcL family Raf kinase inhibitor-like protein [Dermabacter sp.]|nr:YbhB/YbcL family Raf kinase inhibitor-like protein [Dermabacter sp.]